MKSSSISGVVREQGINLQSTHHYGGFPKRIFDLFFLALAAPFVFPVAALLFLLVRLDGGPGFYRQLRVGQYGRRFAMLKLRTMCSDSERVLAEHCAANPEAAAEWDKLQKLHDDPRVTPLGHFLRKTSLDELPQLWNVLLGDMSLVGPRPFMIEQEGSYVDAGGSAYFELKPGITGPWQVYARNGSAFRDRVKYDNGYLKTMSLAGDLWLLLKTVPAVLRAKGV